MCTPRDERDSPTLHHAREEAPGFPTKLVDKAVRSARVPAIPGLEPRGDRAPANPVPDRRRAQWTEAGSLPELQGQASAPRGLGYSAAKCPRRGAASQAPPRPGVAPVLDRRAPVRTAKPETPGAPVSLPVWWGRGGWEGVAGTPPLVTIQPPPRDISGEEIAGRFGVRRRTPGAERF